MDAIKFLKEFGRMCQNTLCSDCILSPVNNRASENCWVFSKSHPETAVSIIEQWAEENPEKTRLQDFVERNPNAPLTEAGYPMMYPKHMGYCKTMDCTKCEHLYKNQLTECWDLPLEE